MEEKADEEKKVCMDSRGGFFSFYIDYVYAVVRGKDWVKYLARPYRRALIVLKNGWTIFAYLSGMHTLLLLVVFNFPTTLSRRPHDIPVLVLIFGVMLLTNLYFMETLLRQHDHYLEVELNQYLEQQMEMMRQRISHKIVQISHNSLKIFWFRVKSH